MSDIPIDPVPQDGIDFRALAHATAGISAMVPVRGVILGYMGWQWGYTWPNLQQNSSIPTRRRQ